MNSEEQNQEIQQPTIEKHPVFQVTTISKYLALLLFILLPFLGGWIGYMYAPEPVVQVQNEISVHQTQFKDTQKISTGMLVQSWSGEHNLYVSDGELVYCLTKSLEDELVFSVLFGVDPASFSIVDNIYIKDNKGVYKVLCPQGNKAYIEKLDVSDVSTFQVAPEQKGLQPTIFLDKNFVYQSLPQEFILQKNIMIDRQTFESIGYGDVWSYEGPEGLLVETQNFYLKDRDAVYKVEIGRLKKIDSNPANFSIENYERNHLNEFKVEVVEEVQIESVDASASTTSLTRLEFILDPNGNPTRFAKDGENIYISYLANRDDLNGYEIFNQVDGVALDYDSFQVFDRGYIKDKNSVFVGYRESFQLIPGADPVTFMPITPSGDGFDDRVFYGIATDDTSVYLFSSQFPDVDVNSFEVLAPNLFRDADRIYGSYMAVPYIITELDAQTLSYDEETETWSDADRIWTYDEIWGLRQVEN